MQTRKALMTTASLAIMACLAGSVSAQDARAPAAAPLPYQSPLSRGQPPPATISAIGLAGPRARSVPRLEDRAAPPGRPRSPARRAPRWRPRLTNARGMWSCSGRRPGRCCGPCPAAAFPKMSLRDRHLARSPSIAAPGIPPPAAPRTQSRHRPQRAAAPVEVRLVTLPERPRLVGERGDVERPGRPVLELEQDHRRVVGHLERRRRPERGRARREWLYTALTARRSPRSTSGRDRPSAIRGRRGPRRPPPLCRTATRTPRTGRTPCSSAGRDGTGVPSHPVVDQLLDIPVDGHEAVGEWHHRDDAGPVGGLGHLASLSRPTGPAASRTGRGGPARAPPSPDVKWLRVGGEHQQGVERLGGPASPPASRRRRDGPRRGELAGVLGPAPAHDAADVGERVLREGRQVHRVGPPAGARRPRCGPSRSCLSLVRSPGSPGCPLRASSGSSIGIRQDDVADAALQVVIRGDELAQGPDGGPVALQFLPGASPSGSYARRKSGMTSSSSEMIAAIDGLIDPRHDVHLGRVDQPLPARAGWSGRCPPR